MFREADLWSQDSTSKGLVKHAKVWKGGEALRLLRLLTFSWPASPSVVLQLPFFFCREHLPISQIHVSILCPPLA